MFAITHWTYLLLDKVDTVTLIVFKQGKRFLKMLMQLYSLRKLLQTRFNYTRLEDRLTILHVHFSNSDLLPISILFKFTTSLSTKSTHKPHRSVSRHSVHNWWMVWNIAIFWSSRETHGSYRSKIQCLKSAELPNEYPNSFFVSSVTALENLSASRSQKERFGFLWH